MTRKTKQVILALFAISLIALLAAGCSNHLTRYGERYDRKALKIIANRIIEHGSIGHYVDGYQKESDDQIPRVVLDTLKPNQKSVVNKYLEKIEPRFPDRCEFALIKYYPGRDINNSTGSMTRDEHGEQNKELLAKIEEARDIILVSLYKSNLGLERYNKHLMWIPDQGGVIENIFFKRHYPGSSYALLHRSGSYYAYYGEYMHQQQLADVDLFIRLIKGGKAVRLVKKGDKID